MPKKYQTDKVGVSELLGVLKMAKPFWVIAFFAALSWLFSWEIAIFLMLALVVHEMGHAWAMLRFRLGVASFSFIPFLGAAMAPKKKFEDRYQEAVCSIMGPVWGTAMALVVGLAAWLTGNWVLAGWTSLIVMLNLFNLVPFGPLDGGRVMKSVLHSLWSPLGWLIQIVGILAGVFMFFLVNPFIGAFLCLISFVEFRNDLKLHRLDKNNPVKFLSLVPMSKKDAVIYFFLHAVLVVILINILIGANSICDFREFLNQ